MILIALQILTRARDTNYTMSWMDQGGSSWSYRRYPPKCQNGLHSKKIKVEALIGNENLTPTSKEEILRKLGSADTDTADDLYWHGDNFSILIGFNEKNQVSNKIATLPNAKKVTNLKDIQPGMTAKEVVEKHGRPETVFVFGYATIFSWKGEDGKDYSVGFDKETVFQISEPA